MFKLLMAYEDAPKLQLLNCQPLHSDMNHEETQAVPIRTASAVLEERTNNLDI